MHWVLGMGWDGEEDLINIINNNHKVNEREQKAYVKSDAHWDKDR